MSTATTARNGLTAQTTPTAAGPGADTAVPFLRLVRVELRKLVDTRSGIGLLVAVGGITVLAVVLVLLTAEPSALTFSAFVRASAVPQAVLLPVLGILAVTGEWSQRTTMTTFVLEPRRSRVATAKLVSAIAFALLAGLVALAAAAVANGIGIVARAGSGSWSLDLGLVGGALLMQLIYVAMGVAFGMAILQSTLAIVGYLLLPTVWMVVSSAVPALETAGGWLDVARTGSPLLEGGMNAEGWLRLLVSTAVWVGVPLVIGYRRWTRREVS